MLRCSATTAGPFTLSIRYVRKRRHGLSLRPVGLRFDDKVNQPATGLSRVGALVPSVHSNVQRWCHVGGDHTSHVGRRLKWGTAAPHHSHFLCSKRCLSTSIKDETPNAAIKNNSGSPTDTKLTPMDPVAAEEPPHFEENICAFPDSSSSLCQKDHLSSGLATGSATMTSSTPASNEVVASTTPPGLTGNSASIDGSDDRNGGDASPEWPEPTLEDLDRSIPQVDCEFIASLIRSRNLRRDEFLARKEALKQRVEETTKKTTPTVSEAVKLPLVGGLSLGWFNVLKGGDEAGGESGLVATSIEAPVVASAAVLKQLSEEERDLLHTTRPEYDDGFVLLDCRTVNEVTSWGIIEGAKVLPAHELFEAFHATPEEFLQDYGFAKPRPDDIIICYCQYGPRSLMAAQILSWMGYLKVMHFRDGYYEWGKQYNLLLRRWMEHDKESGNELRRIATFRAGLELQREIAPEFNALPIQEARQYLRDTTRSPGTLLVGEGLRLEAYKLVAKLTEGLAPPLLPGVVGDDNCVSLTSSGDAPESRATRTRRLREQQLTRFLEQTTGLDPKKELSRPALSLSMGEAQATVLDALAYGHELGVSPDATTAPPPPP